MLRASIPIAVMATILGLSTSAGADTIYEKHVRFLDQGSVVMSSVTSNHAGKEDPIEVLNDRGYRKAVDFRRDPKGVVVPGGIRSGVRLRTTALPSPDGREMTLRLAGQITEVAFREVALGRAGQSIDVPSVGGIGLDQDLRLERAGPDRWSYVGRAGNGWIVETSVVRVER